MNFKRAVDMSVCCARVLWWLAMGSLVMFVLQCVNADDVTTRAKSSSLIAADDLATSHVLPRPLTSIPIAPVVEAVVNAGSLAQGAEFGSAVAVSGDTLLVGAPSNSVASLNYTGSVHVFDRQQGHWREHQFLVAFDAARGKDFGAAVGLSLDTAIVGAPYGCSKYEQHPGQAYVFARNEQQSWSIAQKLQPSASANCDYFGSAISISEDTALIGSREGAHVFERSNGRWSSTDRVVLKVDGGVGSSGAVTSISLYGATALVGGTEVVSVFTRSGSGWSDPPQLLHAPTMGGGFGAAVAVHADTALVGAPLAEVAGHASQGMVYVYKRSGDSWMPSSQLVSGESVAGINFGATVALDNAAAFISAPSTYTQGQGAIYRFLRSGSDWSGPERLTAQAPGAGFGDALALGAEHVIVGSPAAIVESDIRIGAVDVFPRDAQSGSTPEQLFVGRDILGKGFGNAVAVDGDTAIVGAPGDDSESSAPFSGSVFVFARQNKNWVLQQQLTAPNTRNFGSQVALSGDTAFVGNWAGAIEVFVRGAESWSWKQTLKRADTTTYTYQGAIVLTHDEAYIGYSNSVAVYLREGDVWHLEQELSVPDTTAFGSAIAIDGDTLVIGASIAWPGFTHYSAHVFTRTPSGWAKLETLEPPETAPNFGSAVAVSGDTVVVGASYAPTSQSERRGGAYVFMRKGSQWPWRTTLTSADADGLGASVALQGDTLVLADASDVAQLWLRSSGEWSRAAVLGGVGNSNSQVGSIALSRNTVIIGRSNGSASIYRVDGLAGEVCGECASWLSSTGETRSYTCVDDVCCNSACTDHACGACTTSKGGAVDGACTPKAASGRYTCNGGYLCNGADLDCPSTCKSDRDCTSDWYCSEKGSCVPKLQRASECDKAAHCMDKRDCEPCQQGLFCVEGVCCNSACAGPCDTCRARGGESDDGTCVARRSRSLADPPCAGNLLCNGIDALCPQSCESHADCEAAYYCGNDKLCHQKGRVGAACSEAAGCNSGHCVDEVCCNEACDNSCEACNEPGSEGTCAGINGPPRPHHPACIGEPPCTGYCKSEQRDGCAYPDHTQTCGTPSCNAGSEIVPVCNGQGSCISGPQTACSSPYACKKDKTGCASSCVDVSECVAGANCNVSEHQCVYVDTECNGFLVVRADAVIEDCRPYKCRTGACRDSCDKDSDCSPDHHCEDAKCVSVASAGGCGCSTLGNTRALPSGLLLGSLGALVSLARRRKLRRRHASRSRR